MRNKKYILLFISLLFFITNVKADNLNLDEIITNDLEKETINYVEITSLDNIDKLNLWKSKNTKYYNVAIKVWTDLDVRKRTIAKNNNLNYKEFWNLNEAKQFIDSLIK